MNLKRIGKLFGLGLALVFLTLAMGGSLDLIKGAQATPGSLKWRYREIDGNIYSSPAIGSDGTIYYGYRGRYFYALNPDGSLKWRYEMDWHEEVYSTPAIGSDGTIYFTSYIDGDKYRRGHLYALNPDGSLKWRFKGYLQKSRISTKSSPAIGSDGTIYFGSGHYLYALNPDGSLKWWYETGPGYVGSSPAIGSDGTIYFASYSYFYALNPDGSLKWRSKPGDGVGSYPAIGSDGTIYFGSGYHLYALNPDGSLKWRFKTPWHIRSSPAIGSDGTIYFGSGYHFYALYPTGSLKWKYEEGRDFEPSSPAIGSDGTIYFGEGLGRDEYLYALNPDGSLKWKFDIGGHVGSSPAIGSDGTIYLGSSDGYLYAINSSSLGLAASSWPMFRHDLQRTGNVSPLAAPAAGLSEQEPNDSLATANFVAIPFQLKGNIIPAGDRDFFTFTGSVGAELIIDIDAQAIGSSLDSYLILYDKDGSLIASNDDANGYDSQLRVTLNYSGKYYIEVGATGGTGPYVLTVIYD